MSGVDVKLCRPFRVAKRGHTDDECQDAYAIDVANGRFAVADGATESADSGLWAALLVEAFEHGGPDPWQEWLAPVQRDWADAVRVPDDAALPWFLERRYRDGAFSTLLGVWFKGEHWKGIAVGDTCLFHVRDNKLKASYPIERSSDFDSTPWLIGSRSPAGDVPEPQSFAGSLRPGDQLLMMTDALSCWFLASAEQDREPWLALEGLARQSDEAFAEWINLLRDRRELKNDDTTLVAIYL